MFSEGNYITLIALDKKYVLKYSLSKFQDLRIFDFFIRTHRNYAVHKKKIDSVSFTNKSIVVGGQTLPLGRTYLKPLRQIIASQFK